MGEWSEHRRNASLVPAKGNPESRVPITVTRETGDPPARSKVTPRTSGTHNLIVVFSLSDVIDVDDDDVPSEILFIS